MNPKFWTDVYPQGTKQGDEEQAVFLALARHPKWHWRTVAALSKESDVSAERIEQILYKYWKINMVFQDPRNENQWAYWERVPEMMKKSPCSIGDKDQEDRLKKVGINP